MVVSDGFCNKTRTFERYFSPVLTLNSSQIGIVYYLGIVRERSRAF